MRAISLWQPWATAIAVGAKRMETRHWSTDYRGPLAIHASKRSIQHELTALRQYSKWEAALYPAIHGDCLLLPFGAIVAVCNLVDCTPTEQIDPADLDRPCHRIGPSGFWTERMMGDFGPERFGWTLEKIIPLPADIPYKGRQSFFNVDDSLFPTSILEALDKKES